MKKLLLLGLSLLTACMSFSDESLRPVRDSITQQLPEITLEKEFAVSIGGGLFNFLDVITLNEADLSELDHVQVAVYRVGSTRGVFDFNEQDFNELNFEETVLAKDNDLHWETIVRVREEGEQVWVLVGMDLENNSMEAVTVFILGRDELVLINADGEFEELLEFALEPAGRHRSKLDAG